MWKMVLLLDGKIELMRNDWIGMHRIAETGGGLDAALCQFVAGNLTA
jgi:hypothetical protein